MRITSLNRAVFGILGLVALPPSAWCADLEGGWRSRPTYERRGLWSYAEGLDASRQHDGHPTRITNRSPGYVGSDYGLGKPTVSGIGPRPDWGRSSE